MNKIAPATTWWSSPGRDKGERGTVAPRVPTTV